MVAARGWGAWRRLLPFLLAPVLAVPVLAVPAWAAAAAGGAGVGAGGETAAGPLALVRDLARAVGLSKADLPVVVATAAGLVVAAILLALLLASRRRLVAARQVQGHLLDLSERLQEMLSSAPDGYFCWDLPGGGESCSGRLKKLLGLAAEDAPEFDAVRRCFDESSLRELDNAVAALRGRGAAFDLLLTLLATRGGMARTFRIMGLRATGPEGAPVADLLWFRDLTSFVANTARLIGENEALSAEAVRLRALLDAVPFPVWLRRPDLTLSYCNAAYGKAVESDPAGAVAEGREIAGGVVADGGQALAQRANATGMSQFESHHVVIDGQRRLLEFAEAPLEGDSIESGEIAGYATDFTDLEKVQTDLSRQITAHEDALENLSTAVALYGADKRLRFFNTAYRELWRLDRNWLRTSPTFVEVLEAQREARRLPEFADFQAFKKERLRLFFSLIAPHEELLHLPDETTLRMAVVPDPLGGLLFTYDDVTDKLALERSYNTLTAVQRETLDYLYEGVAVFGRDGRLKLYNPAYARIWKLSEDQLAGEPHIADLVEAGRDFYGIEDDAVWAETKTRMVAQIIETTSRSGRFERRDGTVLEYAAMPLPDGNVLLSYLNVTDRHRVEQALRERNQALETASRLKSEFIANVSYELRTPLNTIIGFSEILKKEYFGKLNERQKEYSDGILESSQRLLSLINDILDLATIEAGYMALDLETVDIHGMLVGVLSLTRERARARDLKLEFVCPPHIGTLYADQRRLRQAVFNLISNSIKFTPPGGQITLAAARNGDEVLISISDTGIGLAKEDQERVFEKFVQASEGRPRQSGAGLGLSLVKSFIELHGGRVVMESAPNAGTRVTCYLPARATEAGTPSAAATV